MFNIFRGFEAAVPDLAPGPFSGRQGRGYFLDDEPDGRRRSFPDAGFFQ